jgi:hypothetical protein
VQELAKHTEFVNRQIEFHARQADRQASAGNDRTAAKHRLISESYKELQEFIQSLAEAASGALSRRENAQNRLALSWDEVKDLPPELVAELSVSEGDKLEFDMISILSDCGGVASLDRVLMELYRRTGEIYKRSWITNRLYRMAQKESIFSVPGKKGVYSVEPLDKEAADSLS